MNTKDIKNIILSLANKDDLGVTDEKISTFIKTLTVAEIDKYNEVTKAPIWSLFDLSLWVNDMREAMGVADRAIFTTDGCEACVYLGAYISNTHGVVDLYYCDSVRPTFIARLSDKDEEYQTSALDLDRPYIFDWEYIVLLRAVESGLVEECDYFKNTYGEWNISTAKELRNGAKIQMKFVGGGNSGELESITVKQDEI